MITHLDNQLARLFGKLMSEGVWDNTLVIYTTDHGEFLGDHGAGRKNSFCEASARIPFILRPPKAWRLSPGRHSDALVQLVDILPTLTDVAGIQCPDDIDGENLLGVVKDKKKSLRSIMHGNIDSTHMLHNGRYKYIYYTDDGAEFLFDTQQDRNDMNPLTGTKVNEMREALVMHLSAENHKHVEEGVLLNRHTKRPSEDELLAINGAALAPLDGSAFSARHTLHLDLEGDIFTKNGD
jgi:arylsulfatase A-like enzyme